MPRVTAAPFKAPANPQGQSPLLRQPVELVQACLAFVDGRSLLKNVAPACQGLNAQLIAPVFKDVYGRGPAHRDDITDWKQLVMEQLAIREKCWMWTRVTPEAQALELLDWRYTWSDAAIYSYAKTCLVRLQDSAERGSCLWTKAMIVALTAQRRHRDVQRYWERLGEDEGLGPEYVALLNARFGSEFPGDWKDVSETERSRVRDACAVGAAAAGNVVLLQELCAAGFDPGISVIPGPTPFPTTAALAAATNGRVDVLAYLRANGVNVLAPPPRGHAGGRWYGSLWCAAANNQAEAAEFLLAATNGPVPELNEAFVNALRLGHVEVARKFVAHDPTLATTRDGGYLLLECLLEVPEKKFVRSMAYLVDEAGVDINAKNPIGYAMAHLVARRRAQAHLLKALYEHGADLSITDCYGDTPLEIVYREPLRDDALVQWLVSATPDLPENFFDEKERVATELVTNHRDAVVQECSNLVRLAGVDAPETRQYVETCYMRENVEGVLGRTLAKQLSAKELSQWKERNALQNWDYLSNWDYGQQTLLRRFAQHCQATYKLRRSY